MVSASTIYGQNIDTLNSKSFKTQKQFDDTLSQKEGIKIVDDSYYNETVDKDVLPIDSINKKNRKFLSFIVKNIYSGTGSDTQIEGKESEFSDENSRYAYLNGYKIDTIVFISERIGGSQKGMRKMERLGSNITNALHVTTKSRVLRKSMLLKQDDYFNVNNLALSEFLLRQTGYLTDARITPMPLADSTMALVVVTRDKLSLGGALSYVSYEDSKISVYDRNFLGYGNTFEIAEYFNKATFDPYTAIGVKHVFNNMWGSFTNFRTEAAYGEDRLKLEAELTKNFVKAGDYAYGAGFLRDKWLQNFGIVDTLFLSDYKNEFAWFGKSFNWGNRGNTPFITVGYDKMEFYDTPDLNLEQNPYFRDAKSVLSTLGIYRENYYQSNMINSFGYTEDIPYGYKAELTGGKVWDSYGDYYYARALFSLGKKSLFGYFNTSVEFSTYINKSDYERSIVKYDLMYMSNLFRFKKNFNLRLFLRTGYTGGFNMLDGERQRVSLTNYYYRLRGIGFDNFYGTSRIFASQENVLFTPWHVLGFRFALFNFCDVATLGMNSNPFKNDFAGSLGVGIRIRNDNLIFDSIEIRLSTLLNYQKGYINKWNYVTSPQEVLLNRFVPTAPSVTTLETYFDR